jgi:hypothetical protein
MEERLVADEYRIVTYSPEFRPQILELQNHLWGHDFLLNSKYFAWKYEDNPYIQDPILYLVMSRKNLVAMRGVFGSRWKFRDDTFTIPCLADSVVIPEHRKRGLIGLINKYALGNLSAKGYQHVFGLSAGPAIYHSFLKFGARDIGKLKILTLAQTDKSNGSFQRVGVSHPVSVSREPLCEAMADLNAKVNNPNKLGHIRNKEYYRWRIRNPLSEYYFIYIGADSICGYMVLQTSVKTGRSRGKIVDWAIDDESLLLVLLRAAIDANISERLEIWACTLTSEQIALLKEIGFRCAGAAWNASGYIRTIQFRPTTKKPISKRQWQLGDCLLTDKRNWDLRMIYSDSN